MRDLFKKPAVFFIIIAISISFFLGYRYVKRNLPLFISRLCEENFHSRISIARIKFSLPFCLEFRDVAIDDSINVEKVIIYPRFSPFILKDRLITATVKIVKPVIKVYRKKEVTEKLSRFLNRKIVLSKVSAFNLYFSKVYIDDGVLLYTKDEKDWEFIRIHGIVIPPRLYFMKDANFNFTIAGFLKNKGTDFLSPVRVSGYIAPSGLINSKLEARDIKIDALGDIYKNYLSGFISSARVDFASDIYISRNKLIAKCFLEGEDILLQGGSERAINAPIAMSFILLSNFKSKNTEIRNLKSNLFGTIFGKS